MKSKIDSEEDTCDNPCICTVLLGKGHHMTSVLQPQRDIDREKGRERERERKRERERERGREGGREREKEGERESRVFCC